MRHRITRTIYQDLNEGLTKKHIKKVSRAYREIIHLPSPNQDQIIPIIQSYCVLCHNAFVLQEESQTPSIKKNRATLCSNGHTHHKKCLGNYYIQSGRASVALNQTTILTPHSNDIIPDHIECPLCRVIMNLQVRIIESSTYHACRICTFMNDCNQVCLAHTMSHMKHQTYPPMTPENKNLVKQLKLQILKVQNLDDTILSGQRADDIMDLFFQDKLEFQSTSTNQGWNFQFHV